MAFSFARFGNDLYSGKKSFDLVGKGRTWFAIGIGLCVAAVLVLLIKGLNPGLEFRGGSEFMIKGVTNTDQSIASAVMEEEFPDGEAPRISVIGEDSVRVQTERLSDEETDGLREELAAAYDVEPDAVTSSFVGASWGKDITTKAVMSLIIFLALVSLVITLYFRAWQMAVAAIVALLHDLVVTAGVYALTGFEVTPATVIGFLTILGYSLYDTVVVFDKVRENTTHVMSSTRRTYAEAVNLAVNQTLVRSINTSVVALLPVSSIFFIGAILLGAGTLKDISLALMVGIIAGTYSSVFIAPPLLVALRRREPAIVAQEVRVAKTRAAQARRNADTDAVGDAGHASEHADEHGDAHVTDESDVELVPAGAGAPGRAGTRTASTGVRQPLAGATAARATGPRNQPKRARKKKR